MQPDSAIHTWKPGAVSTDAEHYELRHDPTASMVWQDCVPVARIGPPVEGVILVEFLVDGAYPHAHDAIVRSIEEIEEFLLSGRVDAWQYGQYHCGTVSNIYSSIHWRYMSHLHASIQSFSSDLSRFPGFDRRSFAVTNLREDPDWEWGYGHGVYCFTLDGEVVYVGRALGNTLGERVADHLRSLSDPAWKAVVHNESTMLEVFATTKEWGFVTASLEVYLIQHLNPAHNKRLG